MIMRNTIRNWLCVVALPVCYGCSGSSSSTTGSVGGSPSTGGSSATSDQGGSPAQTGGSVATITGGTGTGTGGALATGGMPATGGKGSKGGNPSTGGAKATGGMAATGGSAAAGGVATTTGGSNGTCVESTCGSHKFACWPMPTPASEAATPNHQSYTDLGNGAVLDNITCLVWEKSNVATQGDWQANSDRCAALGTSNWAGYSDWRLPTRVEMASIVDVTRGNKGFASIFTINGGSFATGSYWYETIKGINNANLAWTYGGNGLTSNAMPLTTATQVSRCVRGNGTGEAPDVLAVAPPNQYTVIATGEVQDNYTGLIWQQGYSPTTVAFADAPAYCASLTLNGHTGWRVPALNELASSVDEALVGSAANPTAFPGNPNGCKDPKYWFWAAEASLVGGDGWGLSYCDGFTGTNVGAAAGVWDYFPTANVRCVR